MSFFWFLKYRQSNPATLSNWKRSAWLSFHSGSVCNEGGPTCKFQWQVRYRPLSKQGCTGATIPLIHKACCAFIYNTSEMQRVTYKKCTATCSTRRKVRTRMELSRQVKFDIHKVDKVTLLQSRIEVYWLLSQPNWVVSTGCINVVSMMHQRWINNGSTMNHR